ncbi:hypothetical protein [Undibacterium fentianense]|uniref:Uncharacterized protein n=1 Tax=Undibacterium fentianense TaxID=2828728 RepID=A0A941E4H3_9BURK|nr:hypothetical protein [Undibacterium fentianense]MBR7798623.1 hypothetical protein [Undibacterium fentianense]
MSSLRRLILFSLTSVFIVSGQASAIAQQREQDNRARVENRRQIIRDFQEFRAARKLERQNDKMERNADREPIRPLKREFPNLPPIDEKGEKPFAKMNRLSPEERMALRRQIREAREEIYLRR